MIKKWSRARLRKRRHLRLRKKVLGTKERPRVCVFRSARNISLQLLDDMQGHTLCSMSTLSKEWKEKSPTSSKNMEAARAMAERFAQKLKDNNIRSVVFDRSGYRYHGKVKVVAEVLCEQGFLT